MFLVTWLFDKLGYMPKISIDATWPFPVSEKKYEAPEFEKSIAKKPVAKMTAKKPTKRKAK